MEMKKITYHLLFIFVLIALFQSCAIPKNTHKESTQIPIGPGPEDFILDESQDQPRLLISCDERRAENPPNGEIYSFNLITEENQKMPRLGEPEDFIFHPHGIDLNCESGTCYLYVISHNERDHLESIVKYEVDGLNLKFVAVYNDPLLVSPNALTAFGDGTFLVSNDAGKKGSIWEMLFKLKRAKLIFFDGEKYTQAYHKKHAYGNGITHRGNQVYLATTRQNKLFAFDFENGKLSNRRTLAKIKGQDNLRFDGEDLILAVHLKLLAFIKHFKNAEKKSPSTVYRIDPKTGEKELVYINDGEQISASATGIIYQNNLYISQVFDPFILKVPLTEEQK